MAPKPPPPDKNLITNCTKWENVDLIKEDALEEVIWNGLKMWHIIFLSILAVLSLVILLCCCVKFRIPRTKQEIEADYIRRKILRKFRKRLKAIQNQELDEMDLKKALDKIRAEFKSDTESLAQSEAGFSAATISSTGAGPGATSHGATYRRASQIQIDISLEDLRAHSMGMKARVALAFARLCGRSKTSKSDKVALTVDAEGEAQISVPEGAFKTKKSDKNKDKKTDPPPPAKSLAPTPKEVKGKTPPAAAATPTPKTLAPPKEKTQKVKKGKKGAQPPPPTEAAHTSMEVKGQQGTTAEQTQGKASSGPIPDKKVKETKKEKEDKKQKEKEKEERKQREKEEKQKQKEEKTKLKIENEKAQKAQKEKEKQEKLDKKKEKGAKPGDKVDKDKK